ncbi:MAG: RHS repeat-associated core domain-containing protein [Bacteroidota bacterium]
MQRRQQIPQEYSSQTNFSEGWQVGGDAYTAVAVAKKTGTGSWVVYNIFRDHLGTITHLKNGSTIDEYSFDSWGRRRDKDNWSYTLSGEPALFADRGFTSHEYLEDFKLYNMNGRLYDPVVGRFLNPDPYIADPSFTQSYNRYSYVLNNPLKYNDPTGELPFLAWLGIAWVGNYLMGVADNHINKGMSVKDAFRNTNIVAGLNFSPSDMTRSNKFGFSSIQVDAQKAALHEEKIAAYLTAWERSQSGRVLNEFINYAESTIDGLTYTSTGLIASFHGGFRGMYLDFKHNKSWAGYGRWYPGKYDTGYAYGFTFGNGFKREALEGGILSWNNGKRVINGTVGILLLPITVANTGYRGLDLVIDQFITGSIGYGVGKGIDQIPNY